VGKIQVGNIKEVFRGNNRIDYCIIPELSNESLAKVKTGECGVGSHLLSPLALVVVGREQGGVLAHPLGVHL